MSIFDYAKLYEELRKAIDGGSESMTHKNALEAVRYWQDQPTPQQEFIATATHSQTHGRIEFTGTEALTELLGRFGSGRLVHLCAADTLERLTAERDALAKDAERYRWLRTCNNDSHVIYGDTQNCELMMEEVLDAAIDAAIKGEKP